MNPHHDGCPVVNDSLLLQGQVFQVVQLHYGLGVFTLERGYDMVDVGDVSACIPLSVDDDYSGWRNLHGSVPIKANAVSNPLPPQLHDLCARWPPVLPADQADHCELAYLGKLSLAWCAAVGS